MTISIIAGLILLHIWTTISFAIGLVSGQTTFPTSNLVIQLPKCCELDEEYAIGMDICRKVLNDIAPQEMSPKVYSTLNNRNFSRRQFNITYNNKNICQDGLVTNISSNFQLFENGSLLIFPHRIVIPENEFCVDQYRTLINPENKAALVVRYCAPDPCINRPCIRKCCPFGMVMNKTDNRCQKVTENLRPFQLRNEFGVAMILPTGKESLAVRDAAYPNCQHGTTNLVPDSGDCFSILPNGTMFLPELTVGEQYSDQYCVDYLDDANRPKGHRSVIGIKCKAPPSAERITEDVMRLLKAYPYLLYFSSIFLVATFMVYVIIPEIRNNVHGISVMCYVASLAVMNIGLGTIVINHLHNSNGPACIGLAIVTHFSVLSSYAWLTVMSFDIWYAFSNLRPTSRPSDGNTAASNKIRGGRRLKFYFLFACSVPFIIVMSGIIADKVAEEPIRKCWFNDEADRQSYLLSRPVEIILPHFDEKLCWFSSTRSKPALAYLYGPICFSSFANISFFVSTIFALRRANKDVALAVASKTKANKKKFRVIFCIFILMGLTFIFQFAAVDLPAFINGRLAAFWVVVDFFCVTMNAVIIFIMFVCKPTVWKRLQLKFPILKRMDGLICSPSSTFIRKKRARVISSQQINECPAQLQ